MAELLAELVTALCDVIRFAEVCSGITLRSYQVEVARAIVDSVLGHKGLTFVVIFPRQSGKNELQAQIETFLLRMHSMKDVEIVKVSPTWKPQSLNAMRRLERVLRRNLATPGQWSKESGFIYRIGQARIFFLSGAPVSNVVGATASLLLECDEAQDVQIAKWDKEFNPMAASTNATRVFWGTPWSTGTLLQREKQSALEAERQDGIRRVFIVDADSVGREVPAYRRFVDGELRKLGRQHPFVRSQYYVEEIDGESGMFPEGRRALMRGAHLPLESPSAGGGNYAFLLDVAGEDEGRLGEWEGQAPLHNPGRDATALTVVSVQIEQPALNRLPTYRVVKRYTWVGVRHAQILGQIQALVEAWGPRWLVCDSTGVGAGLASFLAQSLSGRRVIPFVFTQASKSSLGWRFLAAVETGRFKEYAASQAGAADAALSQAFWRQVETCGMEVLVGPNRLMRWGVPDGARDPASGELLHDDLLVSAALCAVLDGETGGVGASAAIHARDPFWEMREVY